MADGYTTMYDILKNSLVERRERYGTTAISHIVIDGNKFGGYKTFSSFWEKTYVKQPERSASGVIDNLNSYATFVTFHLKVDFAMMSIDDYRNLYKLMLSKNEFIVTAYNVLDNKNPHTCKMYFAPDQMPKLYAVARKLQGQGEPNKFIEVLGVQDYTIELIGTNAQLGGLTVTYQYNIDNLKEKIIADIKKDNPNSTVSVGISEGAYGITVDVESGQDIIIGQGADSITNKRLTALITITNEQGITRTKQVDYKFKKWNESENGESVNYLNGQTYTVLNSISFFAQWEDTNSYTLSYNYGLGEPQVDSYGNAIYSKEIKLGDPYGDLYVSTTPSVKFNNETKYPYRRKGWYKTPQIGFTVDESGNQVEVSPITSTTPYSVVGNSTIYQIFEPLSYTLTFNSNGGTSISAITTTYDSTVAIPIPKKDGKTFKGWYYDEKFERPFGGKMPPVDATLYAKWE